MKPKELAGLTIASQGIRQMSPKTIFNVRHIGEVMPPRIAQGFFPVTEDVLHPSSLSESSANAFTIENCANGADLAHVCNMMHPLLVAP